MSLEVLCVTVSLDTENMSFGEINSSLLIYWRVHANLSRPFRILHDNDVE